MYISAARVSDDQQRTGTNVALWTHGATAWTENHWDMCSAAELGSPECTLIVIPTSVELHSHLAVLAPDSTTREEIEIVLRQVWLSMATDDVTRELNEQPNSVFDPLPDPVTFLLPETCIPVYFKSGKVPSRADIVVDLVTHIEKLLRQRDGLELPEPVPALPNILPQFQSGE